MGPRIHAHCCRLLVLLQKGAAASPQIRSAKAKFVGVVCFQSETACRSMPSGAHKLEEGPRVQDLDSVVDAERQQISITGNDQRRLCQGSSQDMIIIRISTRRLDLRKRVTTPAAPASSFTYSSACSGV